MRHVAGWLRGNLAIFYREGQREGDFRRRIVLKATGASEALFRGDFECREVWLDAPASEEGEAS